jgi:hypothetical protein
MYSNKLSFKGGGTGLRIGWIFDGWPVGMKRRDESRGNDALTGILQYLVIFINTRVASASGSEWVRNAAQTQTHNLLLTLALSHGSLISEFPKNELKYRRSLVL